MDKRGGRKQHLRPIVIQQAPPLPHPVEPSETPTAKAPPPQVAKPIWKKVPGWALVAVSFLAAVVTFCPVYPTLSINEDYRFDTVFPYNTSFSITNEGLWPLADLSVTCGADFVMRPWAADPSDKSSMNLHTQSSEYKDVARFMPYKHRVTVPCNHNEIANGHRIDPDAKLHIVTAYRLWGTRITLHKTFELRTVMGWNGQSYWQYE